MNGNPKVLQYAILATWLVVAPLVFGAVAHLFSDIAAVFAVLAITPVAGFFLLKVQDKIEATKRDKQADE